MVNVQSIVPDKGTAEPEMSLPLIGIPEGYLIHEVELRQEEVFERNFESKPIRVIEGLLATAVDFEESDIAQYLLHEVGLLEMVKSPSERVVEALKSFVAQQAKATGDNAWNEVGEVLRASGSSGSGDLRVGQAVMAYIDASH